MAVILFFFLISFPTEFISLTLYFDEKIYELRKKLNLTNLNTEVDQVLEDEQSGRKNVNESNIIKKIPTLCLAYSYAFSLKKYLK